MARATRQLKILEIISKCDVDTQEELVEKLRQESFNVTQATVSRDIKDMNIIKILAEDGRHYRYVAQKVNEPSSADKFLKIFRSTVISIKMSENLIVIKTEVGSAGTAAALIDKLNIVNVIGVIAGDDTIFVAVDSLDNTEDVLEKFEDLML